jgi:hypothetical protein
MTWSILTNQAAISKDAVIYHSSYDMFEKCNCDDIIGTNKCESDTDCCTSNDNSCDCDCGCGGDYQ